jgi:hypothetical protein
MRTEQQNENLRKLATHLENLPKDYEHFDMGVYFDHNGSNHTHEGFNPNTCGTVACAVGHGPAAGIPVDVEEFYDDGKRIYWNEYGIRSFADDYNEYKFMFSGAWAYVDDTPHGAAARIRYVLDENPVPDIFTDGTDPSVYVEYLK